MESAIIFHWYAMIQLVNLVLAMCLIWDESQGHNRFFATALIYLTCVSILVATFPWSNDPIILRAVHTQSVLLWAYLSEFHIRLSHILLRWIPSDPRETSEHSSFRSDKLADCRDILRAKTVRLDDHRRIKNNISDMEARALPNQRLIEAFDIGNCFVTSDKAVCNTFKTGTKAAVQKTDEEWRLMRDQLRSDFKTFISKPPSVDVSKRSQSVPMVPLVQALCLKIVVHAFQGFMELTDLDVDDDFYYSLAHGINQQWLLSKSGDDIQAWKWSEQHELQGLLAKLKGSHRGGRVTSESTPMNVILPGYETLWRVVLRCFIEVAFRNPDDDGSSRYAAPLLTFVDRPTVSGFDDDDASHRPGLSAAVVAKEALRLYPPTRRIHRRFETAEGVTVDADADVEALHRAAGCWGEAPLAFRPERWVGEKDPTTTTTTTVTDNTAEQNRHFLAFGAAPFTCVAKDGHGGKLPFGPAMVALISGVLVEGVGADEYDMVLTGEEAVEFEQGLPLRTGREDYAKAMLLEKV